MIPTMKLENLNNIQKIVLSFFVSLILSLFFLHNPFSGYITEKINPLYEKGIRNVPCTPSEKADFRKEMLSLEGGWTKLRGEPWTEEGREREAAYIDSSVDACTKSVPYEITAPFIEWRSNEPVLNWFGSIVNMFQLVASLIIIFTVVFFLFKENNKEDV